MSHEICCANAPALTTYRFIAVRVCASFAHQRQPAGIAPMAGSQIFARASLPARASDVTSARLIL